MTKWSLSQECKIQLMFRSISVTDCIQCNIISIDMERHLSNYKCPFLSLKKNSQQTRNRWGLPQLEKEHLQKTYS